MMNREKEYSLLLVHFVGSPEQKYYSIRVWERTRTEWAFCDHYKEVEDKRSNIVSIIFNIFTNWFETEFESWQQIEAKNRFVLLYLSAVFLDPHPLYVMW